MDAAVTDADFSGNPTHSPAFAVQLQGKSGVKALAWTTAVDAFGVGAPHSGLDALPDDLTLEFGDSPKKREYHPARWRGGVDGLGHTDEVDVMLPE